MNAGSAMWRKFLSEYAKKNGMSYGSAMASVEARNYYYKNVNPDSPFKDYFKKDLKTKDLTNDDITFLDLETDGELPDGLKHKPLLGKKPKQGKIIKEVKQEPVSKVVIKESEGKPPRKLKIIRPAKIEPQQEEKPKIVIKESEGKPPQKLKVIKPAKLEKNPKTYIKTPKELLNALLNPKNKEYLVDKEDTGSLFFYQLQPTKENLNRLYDDVDTLFKVKDLDKVDTSKMIDTSVEGIVKLEKLFLGKDYLKEIKPFFKEFDIITHKDLADILEIQIQKVNDYLE
jgi:hypothetical protein